MNIIQKPSPNFTKGRKNVVNKKVIAIVEHITAGLMPGCLSWMCNPKAKASAHFLVAKDGKVYQLVNVADTAWTCGLAVKPIWSRYDGSNPNYYTINIEHECISGGELTEEQYQSTLALHRLLIDQFDLLVNRDTLVGHGRIDTVNRPNDPGDRFPWDRLFKDLATDDAVPIRVGGTVVQGMLVGNKTYAPVRDLLEALGRTVKWDESTRSIDII